MMSRSKVQIFVPAGVLAVLAALLILTMPIDAASVRAITVKVGDGVVAINYPLESDETRDLVQALQGSKVPHIQGRLVATYDVTLYLGWQPPRRYEVSINEAREVFLKRTGLPSKAVLSDHPGFFYAHEAFVGLYPHSEVPDVQIVAAEQAFTPPAQSFDWQFLKWDNEWSSAAPELSSGQSSTMPVINTADQKIEVNVSPAPDRVTLSASGPSGNIVYEGPLLSEGWPLASHNGVYHYELSLFWEEEAQHPFKGRYDASFSVELSLPTVYELPESTIAQGELARLVVRHAPAGVEPVLETDFSPAPRFYPYGDGFVAYFPTNYNTPLRQYSIAYGLPGSPLQEHTITVRPHNYHIQHMSIDPSIAAATRNDEAYAQFARYFPPSRETSAPERYHTESFLIPVGGRLTTEFGQTRYVNNSPTGSRHSGLDIAAPTGTPIIATNTGKVTLSMYLILTGNTIVIDHGQGLFSVHFHLHDLSVEKGQIVKRGQTIGTVGTTGFSTGPHLHFTMSYYGHNLEPGYFLVGEPITFANSRQYLGR